MEITHFERGNGLISTNNNNITVEFRCSDLEKSLITTDRRELQELVEQKSGNTDRIRNLYALRRYCGFNTLLMRIERRPK